MPSSSMRVLPSGLVGVNLSDTRFPDSFAGQVDPLVNYEDASAQRRSLTIAEKYTHHVTQQQDAQGPFLKAISKTERLD